MRISIRKETKEEHYYEIIVNPNNWIISGSLKKLISNQNYTFECKLIPIVCGNVEIPKVQLHGVPKENIQLIYESNRVTVLPSNEQYFGIVKQLI